MTHVQSGLRAPDWLGGPRAVAAVLIALVLVELWISLGLDISCLTPGTFCASQTDRYGFHIAEFLAANHAFVQLNGEVFTDHPPGFALVLYLTFLLFGWDSYVPILTVQLLMLVGAGFLVRYGVNAVLPGWGTVGMAFVLLNPNLVAHFGLTSTVSFEMFFLSGALAAGLAYVARPRIAAAVACGIAVGLAMWSRPTAQVLILVLPVLFAILELVGSATVQWRRAALSGAAAMLVAFVLISPWMIHQKASGESFRTSSSGHEALLLQDSLRNLYPRIDELGRHAAEVTFRVHQIADLRGQHPDWDSLAPVEQAKLRRDYLIDYYLSVPFAVSDFAFEVMMSWGKYFAAGGEGEFHRLLGMEHNPDRAPAVFLGVKFVALAIAVSFRLLGILGLVEMIRRRAWGVMVLTVGLVLPYLLSTFLVGQPRYRVPVESALIVMAVYGVVLLCPLLRRRGSAPRPA